MVILFVFSDCSTKIAPYKLILSFGRAFVSLEDLVVVKSSFSFRPTPPRGPLTEACQKNSKKGLSYNLEPEAN